MMTPRVSARLYYGFYRSSMNGPRLTAIFVFFLLALLLLFGLRTSSPAHQPPISPVAVGETGRLQLPIKLSFVPDEGQSGNGVYQVENSTATTTADPNNAVPTFVPDPNAPQIFITSQEARFFYNNEDACAFIVTTATPPAFVEPTKFPVISFNPQDSTGISQGCSAPVPGLNTRPLTDLWHQSTPSPCATQPAQDQLRATPTLQAGVGALASFHGLFTGQLYVPTAGDVTFNQYVDDAWVLGIGPKVGGSGEQPFYVSGTFNPPPPPPPSPSPVSAFNGYQVVSQWQTGSGHTDLKQTTVHFPAAGYYPIEFDYTECQVGELEAVLGSTAANPIPNGPSPTLTPIPTVTCATGSSWCTSLSPNLTGANVLNAAFAAADTDAWAVGGYGVTDQGGSSLTEHWNGSAWATVTSPNVGTLNGVAGTGSNDAWAVGDNGVIRWNGTNWVTSPASNGGKAISVFTTTTPVPVYDVWAAGMPSSGTSNIEHYDGALWTASTPVPSGGVLNGIHAITHNDVWAVGKIGSNPLAMHYTGGSWAVVSILIPQSALSVSLASVDAYSSTSVWIAGTYYADGYNHTLIEYWDGIIWRIHLRPIPAEMRMTCTGYTLPTLMMCGLWAHTIKLGLKHRLGPSTQD